jgi:hypothetical protein
MHREVPLGHRALQVPEGEVGLGKILPNLLKRVVHGMLVDLLAHGPAHHHIPDCKEGEERERG